MHKRIKKNIHLYFITIHVKLLADDFPDVGEESNYSLHLVELEKCMSGELVEKLVADIEYNGESYYGLRITDRKVLPLF